MKQVDGGATGQRRQGIGLLVVALQSVHVLIRDVSEQALGATGHRHDDVAAVRPASALGGRSQRRDIA